MKKIIIALFALAVVTSGSALAVTGPEEPNSRYSIMKMDFMKERGLADRIIFSRIDFPQRPRGQDGWDFGGRAGYGCAFIEIVDGGATDALTDDVVIARVVGERYENHNSAGPLYVFMDIPGFGAGNDVPCSALGPDLFNGRASDAEKSRSFAPGLPDHASGHIIQVWQDGVEVGRVQVPHEEVEMRGDGSPGRGAFTWWFRGDQDGEIVLWYENPDTGDYGIIARLGVVGNVPGVTFDDCVIGNPEGTPCPQAYPNEPAPPPPVTQVTLGPGTSELSCPDDSNPVVTQADPLQVLCP